MKRWVPVRSFLSCLFPVVALLSCGTDFQTPEPEETDRVVREPLPGPSPAPVFPRRADQVIPSDLPRPFVATSSEDFMKEIHQDMKAILMALVVFSQVEGGLPEPNDGIGVIVTGPADPTKRAAFKGPYLPEQFPELLTDPWGREYVFEAHPGTDKPVEIRSLGPDGAISEDDILLSGFEDLRGLLNYVRK